jgi:hypothetical protein
LGDPTCEVEGTYVSTTRAGDWLARVGAHGLGDLAAGTCAVHPGGIVIGVSEPWFIPADALMAVALSPGMAGKFYGRDRIVVFTWISPDGGADGRRPPSGGEGLDTGFAPRYRADVAALADAARALLKGSTA